MVAVGVTQNRQAASKLSNRLPMSRPAALFVVVQIIVSTLEFGKLGLVRDGVDVERLLILAPFQFFAGPYLLVMSPELRRVLPRGALAAVSAWFVWALCSAAWSIDPLQTTMQVLGAMSLWLVGVWASDRFGFYQYARLFVAGAGSLVVVGLVGDAMGLMGDDADRWAGLTNATNRLAAVAGAVCVLAVVVDRTRRSWFAAVVASLSLVALVSTGSRAGVGFVGLALGLQFVSAGRSPARRVGRAFCWVSSLGLAGSVLALAPRAQRLQDGRSIETLTGRRGIWTESLSQIGEHPFVGVGAMAEQAVWTESWLKGAVPFEAFHSHNLVLAMLMTTGVVGLVLFGTGLCLTVRSLVVNSDVGVYRVDVAAVLIVLLGMGFTEASFEGPSALFGLLGAVMLVALRRPNPVRSPGLW